MARAMPAQVVSVVFFLSVLSVGASSRGLTQATSPPGALAANLATAQQVAQQALQTAGTQSTTAGSSIAQAPTSTQSFLAPVYLAALQQLQGQSTANAVTSAVSGVRDPASFNNWAALAAALAGSGLIQDYANSFAGSSGRRLQQFLGSDTPLGQALLAGLGPGGAAGAIPIELNNIIDQFRNFNVQLSPEIGSALTSNLLARQVLLARPDLAGQFQNLPALPPAADGLATVLANMAALAQNLNTQGVDVDSLFQNSGSDPALGAVNDLAQTLSGRRLLQEAISIAGGDLADYNPAVDAVDELLDDVAGRRLLQDIGSIVGQYLAVSQVPNPLLQQVAPAAAGSTGRKLTEDADVFSLLTDFASTPGIAPAPVSADIAAAQQPQSDQPQADGSPAPPPPPPPPPPPAGQGDGSESAAAEGSPSPSPSPLASLRPAAVPSLLGSAPTPSVSPYNSYSYPQSGYTYNYNYPGASNSYSYPAAGPAETPSIYAYPLTGAAGPAIPAAATEAIYDADPAPGAAPEAIFDPYAASGAAPHAASDEVYDPYAISDAAPEEAPELTQPPPNDPLTSVLQRPLGFLPPLTQPRDLIPPITQPNTLSLAPTLANPLLQPVTDVLGELPPLGLPPLGLPNTSSSSAYPDDDDISDAVSPAADDDDLTAASPKSDDDLTIASPESYDDQTAASLESDDDLTAAAPAYPGSIIKSQGIATSPSAEDDDDNNDLLADSPAYSAGDTKSKEKPKDISASQVLNNFVALFSPPSPGVSLPGSGAAAGGLGGLLGGLQAALPPVGRRLLRD